MDALIAYSERKAREAIRALPDGVYQFEDFMDHDGIDLSKPIRIKVQLTVRGDTLEFDFTGTDPQVRGPINAPLAKTWTTTFYCVSCVLPQDVPFNEGSTRVVKISVPEGTILNPRHPAPVNARTVTLQRVVDVVHGALAKLRRIRSARNAAAPRPVSRSAGSIRVPARVSFSMKHFVGEREQPALGTAKMV